MTSLCDSSERGAVVVRDAKVAEDIYLLQNAEGNALAPFDCFLLLRGLKTLRFAASRELPPELVRISVGLKTQMI